MVLRLHSTSTGLFLLVLVLLLLLLGSRLCLSRFEWFFYVFGGFIRLTVVIHGYLCFVFFGYGNHLFFAGFLLLVWVPFIEARAVLLLVHTNIGAERLPLLVHHILQIERAAAVECLTLLVG